MDDLSLMHFIQSLDKRTEHFQTGAAVQSPSVLFAVFPETQAFHIFHYNIYRIIRPEKILHPDDSRAGGKLFQNLRLLLHLKQRFLILLLIALFI